MVLPVRKCVLFRHGIGYFEREEKIQGDQNLVLTFKEDVMNDILKSLTTYDNGGGYVSGISYEGMGSKQPNILIDLESEKSMSKLLAEIQGAKIAVNYAGKTYEGLVIGIEEKKKREIEDGIPGYLDLDYLTLLLNENEIKTFSLIEIDDVEFLDEEIKRDLQHLLDVLISSKKKSIKNVTVFCKGKKKRTFRATYIIPLPVWKTSYRVMLGAQEPILQGWAIVDNTTEEDWKNIQLELVSGLPISFIHDLYSPRFQVRPRIEVQDEAAFAPPVLEKALEREESEDYEDYENENEDECEYEEKKYKEEMCDEISFSLSSISNLQAKRKMVSKEDKMKAFSNSVKPDVQTRKSEAVDLCHYIISVPVSVKRDQSALVPIFQGNFSGEQVCVYNQSVRDKNPMSSILFKNTTGLILEGGPITMYEKGEYIGEGMLDTIQPNDTKTIPYAVELGCVVESDYGSTSQSFFHSAILNGVLTTERYYYYWRKYKINNKSTKKLDFILEHKITSNTELVYTIDPFEKTENYYRFRFNVPAKEHITFVVVERSRQPDTYYLESVSKSSVDSWLYSNLINKEIKETLYQIVQKLQSKNDLNRQLSTLKTELNDHIRNQRRICENMKTLKDSQDQRELRDRYVQELTTSEDEIESLRAKIKVLEKELQEMAKVIRQIVHEIKYDAIIDVPKPSLPESQVKAHASINNKKLPYFPEKLDENLPSGFDMDMIKVGISCNSQDFTIHDQRSTTEPITIRSNFPIPDKTKIYYFEITIEDPGTKSTVVIGAVLDSHNLVGLPGWDDSIGFHGDDGKLYFCESKKGRKLGSKFSKNDTIGFGIDFSTKNFFFTFNGKLIKTIRDKKSVLIGKTLYPSIGLNSPNAKVSVNFGSIPFIHQLKSKY